jgi:hydrogenase maturation protein HypF
MVVGKTIERQRLSVQGIVQGVGFRPFVYAQAQKLGLSGFVLNDSAGVTIEIEGTPQALAAFERALRQDAPPLARLDKIERELLAPSYQTGFVIAHSQPGAERQAGISPDTATCADCLHELFDPTDRRYRYPFINCTNCGPRFSIIEDVPYDRPFTTMRTFPMCDLCRREYDDPTDRRFHAQPNACPKCGPRLQLLDSQGKSIETDDPVAEFARQLANGAIGAVKSLGGFHLACNPFDPTAVAKLRTRKHREAKPFALMVGNLETARQLCKVSIEEAELLNSYRRPVVLLARRPDCDVALGVAPGLATLGLMLPYTPLHYLLLDAYARLEHPSALVMTSGNRSDEPIVYRDAEIQPTLHGIADFTLTHNRPIYMRCDDSVTQIVAGEIQFLRRARGYAPESIKLPFECPVPILAVGGQLKNTFALAKGRYVFVSHHIGDLENVETLTSFREGIAHFSRLFDIEPQAVAYDLHPEYAATRYATELDLPHKIGVQHHHAHIASGLAEHGLTQSVIGIAADGTGYGLDGHIWGCEVLIADLTGFERLAQLEYVPLPGGEQAIKQPWRVAAVYLQQAFGADFTRLDIDFVRQLDFKRWRGLAQMIERGVNSPLAGSLGRLFEAVAALVGIRNEVWYEGQAAVELEAIVEPGDREYNFKIGTGQPAIMDVRPLIRGIVDDLERGVSVAQIAGRFHRTIVRLLTEVCLLAREQTGLTEVMLSGGVFQNRRLTEMLCANLSNEGLRVWFNRQVPPNDGGLCLGQLAVAAARLKQL